MQNFVVMNACLLIMLKFIVPDAIPYNLLCFRNDKFFTTELRGLVIVTHKEVPYRIGKGAHVVLLILIAF